jgi:hypothetical protein
MEKSCLNCLHNVEPEPVTSACIGCDNGEEPRNWVASDQPHLGDYAFDAAPPPSALQLPLAPCPTLAETLRAWPGAGAPRPPLVPRAAQEPGTRAPEPVAVALPPSPAAPAPQKALTLAELYPHYHKDVSHLESIDIYRVLDLWGVTDQCLGHAIKKLMAAGQRGAKDVDKDVKEAGDSLQRWKAMQAENKRRK